MVGLSAQRDVIDTKFKVIFRSKKKNKKENRKKKIICIKQNNKIMIKAFYFSYMFLDQSGEHKGYLIIFPKQRLEIQSKLF